MQQPSIVVVGAGIIGCLTAREIVTRRPDVGVLVLDADLAGGGASRRSVGLHFPRGLTDRVRRMSAFSEDYYRRLVDDLPQAPIYPLRMAVVARDTTPRQLRETYLVRTALRPAELPLGQLRLPAGASVWFGDGAHYADVHGLVQLLARDLRGRVRLREGVRVMALEPKATTAEIRLDTGERLVPDQVVLAPGPWVHAAPWRSLTAQLDLRVKRVVATHVDDKLGRDDHLTVFHDEDAFLLPAVHRDDWMFSYTCHEWDVDPDDAPAGLTARHLAQARTELARYRPDLADRCTAGRVFCDAYSPNRQPVIRSLDQARRVVFAGAANGSGYRLGPAIAAAATDLLDLP